MKDGTNTPDRRGKTMHTFSRARHWLIAGLCAALALSPGAAPTNAAPIVSVREFTTGLTAEPQNIVAGPDGNLWFTEPYGNRIGRITPQGAITEFTVPNAAQPYGITAGPDGNLWFTEQDVSKIGRITPAGVVDEFPTPSLGSRPVGIAAGPGGNLWFTEFDLNKIGSQVIVGDPNFVEYALPSGAGPTEIVAGPDGNLWFTEVTANKIGRITRTGALTEFPLTSNSSPNSIASGPDGNLWYTSAVRDRIGRITPVGVITEFSTGLTPGAGLQGITRGPDGNLWFAEASVNKIGSVTPTGGIAEYSLPSGANPKDVVAGPDGNLWYTGSKRIGRASFTLSNETVITATVQTAIEITATPTVDFGQIAVGATKLGAPNPASVAVTTNGGGYTLSVTRTAFSGGADVPLSVAVTAPGGATSALSGQVAIPTSGSLTVGSRSGAPPLAGDEWRPVYQLGPVPLRPAGATTAVVTYTAVAT
jgi:streptogramin lyase